jgi:hypothetical protein
LNLRSKRLKRLGFEIFVSSDGLLRQLDLAISLGIEVRLVA